MFDSIKSCLLILILGVIGYLVAQYFVLQAAKDEGILWLVAVILLGAVASFCGKAAKNLAQEGPLWKFVSGLFIGLFAVGTLALVAIVFLNF